MATLADFLKIQKIDCHNNLQTGMRYESFVRWSGFIVPGFPENEPCSDSRLVEDFHFYSDIKINSKKDVQSLFYMSIAEAAADNVKIIEGAVNLDLCDKCSNPSDFISAIQEVKEKYEATVLVKPILSINSNLENNLFLAETFLENHNFEGIHITGNKFLTEKIQRYEALFDCARRENLRTSVDFANIPTEEDAEFVLSAFKPDCIKNPHKENFSDKIISSVKESNITVQFSAASDSSETNRIKDKAEFMKKLSDNGVKIKICSDSMIFVRKSISEFAADLCNTGLFTEEEVKSFFSYE